MPYHTIQPYTFYLSGLTLLQAKHRLALFFPIHCVILSSFLPPYEKLTLQQGLVYIFLRPLIIFTYLYKPPHHPSLFYVFCVIFPFLPLQDFYLPFSHIFSLLHHIFLLVSSISYRPSSPFCYSINIFRFLICSSSFTSYFPFFLIYFSPNLARHTNGSLFLCIGFLCKSFPFFHSTSLYTIFLLTRLYDSFPFSFTLFSLKPRSSLFLFHS